MRELIGESFCASIQRTVLLAIIWQYVTRSTVALMQAQRVAFTLAADIFMLWQRAIDKFWFPPIQTTMLPPIYYR